jgi:predicted DCC family thiol-disulfide oxidoreductase YuxK
MDTNGGKPVLFFDGTCNLCNGAVQFIIRRDKKRIFLFSPLQSTSGKEAANHLSGPLPAAPGSLILFYNGHYYIRSAAALHIMRLLGGLWALLYVGMIVPRFLRDAAYNLVSRNRYKWFGRKNECMIPTPEIMDRFLSD